MKETFIAVLISLIISVSTCMVAVNPVVSREMLSYSERAVRHISQKYSVPEESLILVNGR